MKLKFEKSKAIAGAATGLLFISLFFGGNYYMKNNELQKLNDQERIKSEKLLSEKLQLDREIEGLRTEITGLGGKNQELDAILAETTNQLNDREAKLKLAMADSRKLKSVSKELKDVKKLRDELHGKIAELNAKIAKLEDENSNLHHQIDALESEADKFRNVTGIATSFRIEVLRGKKEKLTTRAKQADKIAVSFKLPQQKFTLGEEKEIYMVIVGPDKRLVLPKNSAQVNLFIDGSNTMITPAATAKVKPADLEKRFTMEFDPEEDLIAGIYQVDLYTNDAYLGAASVKLRK